jgi:hypothetical protein
VLEPCETLFRQVAQLEGEVGPTQLLAITSSNDIRLYRVISCIAGVARCDCPLIERSNSGVAVVTTDAENDATLLLPAS